MVEVYSVGWDTAPDDSCTEPFGAVPTSLRPSSTGWAGRSRVNWTRCHRFIGRHARQIDHMRG